MNPLHTEFARLYYANPQHARLHDAAHSVLQNVDGQVRCAVLELARPADWSLLAPLWRAAQTDLDLPAPAIAINGADGYQLWFSWQEGVAAAQAHGFVQSLIARYLGDVKASRLRVWPGTGTPSPDAEFPGDIPAMHPRSGQWSAFIAPDLAAVFADEPWLDRNPGLEAQAQLLSRIDSLQPQVFAKAQALLQPAPTAPAPACKPAPAPQRADYPSDTPAAFLQAVMQDPCAPLALRVQAATALMPPTAR